MHGGLTWNDSCMYFNVPVRESLIEASLCIDHSLQPGENKFTANANCCTFILKAFNWVLLLRSIHKKHNVFVSEVSTPCYWSLKKVLQKQFSCTSGKHIVFNSCQGRSHGEMLDEKLQVTGDIFQNIIRVNNSFHYAMLLCLWNLKWVWHFGKYYYSLSWQDLDQKINTPLTSVW